MAETTHRFDSLAQLDAYRTLATGPDQIMELVTYRRTARASEMGLIGKQIAEVQNAMADAVRLLGA